MELDRDMSRRIAIGLGVLGLLALTVYVLYAFIASVVFGVFLYYAVRPIFRSLERFGIRRSLRATLSLLLFGVPFLVLFAYTLAIIASEVDSFLQSSSLVDSATGRIVNELNIAQLDLKELETLLTDTESVPSPGVILDTLVAAASAAGSVFFQLLIVVAVAYYLLTDGPTFVAWFLDTFDESGVLRRYVREVDSELSQTMFGNIVVIFVTGVLALLTFYTFNLFVPGTIEVPYPALSGTLVGVGTLIPVVGIKLVYVPIILGLAGRAWIAGEPGLLLPLAALLVVTAVVLDFIPDIFARARFSGERTHNGLLILAYLMGPALFGFYGLFLAPILLITTIEGVKILLPYALSGTVTDTPQTTLDSYTEHTGAGEGGGE